MNAIITLAMQKRYGATAERMYKAVAILEAKQIRRMPNGNYEVTSQADPHHFYQVNPAYESCNCPDCEKNGNVCKHLLAWKLQGMSASDMEAKNELHKGLLIAESVTSAEDRIEKAYNRDLAKLQKPTIRVLLPVQKRDVIAEREALAKAQQPKRGEWIEELDYA